MISNEQVVERVMRMGIESRCGVPDDRLYDLARKQLAEEEKYFDAARQCSTKYSSIEEWFADAEACRFAFMYVKGKLQVIRAEALEVIRFIEWRSNTMPLIERAYA